MFHVKRLGLDKSLRQPATLRYPVLVVCWVMTTARRPRRASGGEAEPGNLILAMAVTLTALVAARGTGKGTVKSGTLGVAAQLGAACRSCRPS